MKKEEFLRQQTRDVTKFFEENGGYPPTFAVLYHDGTTKSVATSFNGQESKDAFDSMMRKLCENPKVIACVFTCDGWSSKIAREENRRPSECSDRETLITQIFNTRDGTHKVYIYKPDKNGKLRLEISDDSFEGRFSNPFRINELVTKVEKENAIHEFQEQIREIFCGVFEEYQELSYSLFFLYDAPGKIGVLTLTEDEWLDKAGLKNDIDNRSQDPHCLAFMMPNSVNGEHVSFILVAEEVQAKYQYGINPMTHTLEFKSKASYDGEFSEAFK